MEILLSVPVLTLGSIALVLLLGYIINKKYISKNYVDMAVDIFGYIEENYVSWGIKGNQKADFFIDNFVARYKKDFGVIPTQEIIENAVKIVNELVTAQNKIKYN